MARTLVRGDPVSELAVQRAENYFGRSQLNALETTLKKLLEQIETTHDAYAARKPQHSDDGAITKHLSELRVALTDAYECTLEALADTGDDSWE